MSKLTYIDGNHLDQFILKRVLSRCGVCCQVNCTDSSAGVLSLLSQAGLRADEIPEVILLDIYMPGFNPWDFLDQLRLLYPTLAKPIKIYILSARKYPADVERAKRYPFVKAIMLKPITREILERLLVQIKSPRSRFTLLEEASN
jgi:CheY-like chemotaxis protein